MIEVLFYCCHGIIPCQRNFLPYGYKCSRHPCSNQFISFGMSYHKSASCTLSRQIFFPLFLCCLKDKTSPRQSESKWDWKGIKETSSACRIPQERVTGGNIPISAQHLPMPTFLLSIHWHFSNYSSHARTMLRSGLYYTWAERMGLCLRVGTCPSPQRATRHSETGRQAPQKCVDTC